MECCAEIQYGPVHSDICPPGHKAANMDNKSWRLLCTSAWTSSSTTPEPGDMFRIVLNEETGR